MSSIFSFNAVSAVVELFANIGQVFYSRLAIAQADSLHRRELASSIASHFQNLSQDLFAAAKEADRDVWEQFNGRFNNLMVLTVLMLSVSASLITEGAFDSEVSSVFVESLFLLATAAAFACFFASLAASIRATREMSQVMSDRSAVLEERIIQLASRNQLSAGMQALYRKIDTGTRHEPHMTNKDNVEYVPSRATLADEVLQASFESLHEVAPQEESRVLAEGEDDRHARFFTFVTRYIMPLERMAMRTFFAGTACCLFAMMVSATWVARIPVVVMRSSVRHCGGLATHTWHYQWSRDSPALSLRCSCTTSLRRAASG